MKPGSGESGFFIGEDIMVKIVYDDREKFPWAVFVGKLLWNRCRSHRGALNTKMRLERVVDEINGRSA